MTGSSAGVAARCVFYVVVFPQMRARECASKRNDLAKRAKHEIDQRGTGDLNLGEVSDSLFAVATIMALALASELRRRVRSDFVRRSALKTDVVFARLFETHGDRPRVEVNVVSGLPPMPRLRLSPVRGER